MTDLAEFLLARITEDEAVARESFYEGQHWYAEDEEVQSYPGGADSDSVWTSDRKRDSWHIVRWQPSRVLAECEAKRQIVEMPLHWPSTIRPEYREWTFVPTRESRQIKQWSRDEDGDLLNLVRIWDRDEYERTVVQRNESPILKALAAVYADHPDYREEWRP